MKNISSIITRCFTKNSESEILKAVLPCRGNIDKEYPSDFENHEIKILNKAKNFTMTSQERQIGLLRAVEYIVQNNIDGDIVECGVWKGGSMMIIALKLLELNINKNLYLFDTFEGMTNPSEVDNDFYGKNAISHYENANTENWCYSALEEVKRNLETTKYPANSIFFIKGDVKETLPVNNIGKISLLRLDTDWYESTKYELEFLFPKLVNGGVIIIDDFGHWQGAKKAVTEYFTSNNIKIFLHRLDYTGRIGIKN